MNNLKSIQKNDQAKAEYRVDSLYRNFPKF